MIADQTRMQAYERALRDCIQPGDVVLDIGTGTGVFALLACQLGARRVFAVEPSDAVHVAREIAAANGCADRIEFLQALSTAIELPERADVVVSDLRGILPLFHQHIAAVIDARKRHLAPGGVMIPALDTLWVSAVEAPEQYRSLTFPWQGAPYGLDMSAGKPLVVNSFYRGQAKADQIVAGPCELGTIDYRSIDSSRFRGTARLGATRRATAHGLCVWFDSMLSEGVRMSNAPGSPRLIYGSAFFPWTEPLDLEVGDDVTVDMRADLVGRSYVWSWHTRLANALGEVRTEIRQSEFEGEVLSPASLRKQAASYIPALSEDGCIDRLILGMMDDAKPLEEIAREVAARHPARFPRWNDALTHVGELSLRYAR